MNLSCKNNYFFYGLIGSVLVHLLLFFLSGVQNRRRFQEDFVVQLPQRKQHERIYFASVVLPQRKDEVLIKKEPKKSAASVATKSISVPDKKKLSTKKEPEKAKNKEVKKTVEAKKTVEKKVEPAKKKEQKKEIALKAEPKKEVKKIEKKSELLAKQEPEQKKVEIKQEPVPLVQDQALPLEEVPISTSTHAQVPVRDSAQQRKRELFFALAQAIKKEVALHWVPPMTDRKGLQVRVQCTVSPKGKIEQVVLVASSAVIAYDMSVVRAAWKIQTEKPLWGTQFLIAFNQ